MGYDLHITRREFWADDDPEADITMDEWRALIDGDPEMRLDGFAETEVSDGSILRYENEGLAVWTGHSRASDYMGWLDLRGGDVSAKNPDAEIRRKMWSLAQQLGAQVQGDDGELYGEDGEQLAEPKDASSKGEIQGGAKPWWKFW